MTGRSYSRHDLEQLQSILDYCEKIGNFVETFGSDEEDLAENIPFQYSCAFALQQIGEHIKRLSPDFKETHQDIDWRKAAGMRDFIAHNYMDININLLRHTILEDVPLLEEKCKSLVSSSSNN